MRDRRARDAKTCGVCQDFYGHSTHGALKTARFTLLKRMQGMWLHHGRSISFDSSSFARRHLVFSVDLELCAFLNLAADLISNAKYLRCSEKQKKK